MIKKLTILMLFVSYFMQAQIQSAPWTENLKSKNGKTSKSTIDEIAKSAETYFNTIDRNKKGSGLKPFERWKYNWSFYTDDNGYIKPASHLWDAWNEKNKLGQLAKDGDGSNWIPIGPFNNSNTYSANNFQQTGQGRINVVAVDPSNANTMYVGAPAGGIWKSTDAGVNWSPLTDYLPQIGVSGIAIHPTNSNIIYIATGDDDASDSYAVGVYKSIDGGTSWNGTGAIPGFSNSSNDSMNEIYFHSTNTETLLVATSTGVQKTTNGGTSWTTTLSGNIIDLKMKPNDPTIWYASSGSQFFKSTDSGESFQEVLLPNLGSSYRLAIDVTEANPEYIYVLSAKSISGTVSYNGVWKSTDSGVTFAKTSENDDIFQSTQAWYDMALTVSSNNPDIVYVGVLDIWKSQDGGNNFNKLNDWANPNQDSYTHADIHFMRFINGKFYAGTDGGVYLSENEGNKFVDLTKNLAISQFYRISVAPNNSNNVVGGHQDNGGYAYNDGMWRNYHGGDGMEGIVDPTEEDTHYGFVQYGGNLYKTINGGRSNTFVTSSPENERNAAIGDSGGEWVTPLVSDKNGTIYSGYKDLYKLESNAWVKVSDLSLADDIDHIELDPNNLDNFYMAQGSTLYKSTDKGVTFNTVSFSHGTINSIEVHNQDSNIVWIVTSGGVYRSDNILDETPTFTDITGNLPSETKMVVKHHLRSNNNTIYLGTALGVYTYNDDTKEWATFDTNLPNTQIRDLEVNEKDSKLFAATYGRGSFYTIIPRKIPAIDVSLNSVEDLSGKVNCGTALTPILNIKNDGLDTLTELSIDYTYDSGTTENYVWNGTINTLETKQIELPLKNLELGIHTLSINVNKTDDAYLANNSLEVNFQVNNSVEDPFKLFTFEALDGSENFIESTDGDSPTFWSIGSPRGTLLKNISSGKRAYVTNNRGEYPEKTNGYLTTRCYDLSIISDPKVKFQMAFDIELDWDYLVFEYTTDNGVNWNILGDATSPNWYNSAALSNSTKESTLPGKQWTGEGENGHLGGGTNATLREYSHDLSSLGNETNVIFRFKFHSDDLTVEEGVVIDDFGITGTALSTTKEDLKGFAVFPNPSRDIFNITWNNQGNAELTVYNYLGKMILSNKSIQNNSFKVDLSNQSKGLYFIKINVDGKQAVKKVILE